MACGVPVIVSSNTVSKEAIREGIDEFVLPIRDVEALKGRILFFYEHPEARKEMGDAASKRAYELTWDKYEHRAVEIYSEIKRRTGKSNCL